MKHTERQKKAKLLGLAFVAILAVTSCTKKRAPELPEDMVNNIFSFSEIGTASDKSAYATMSQNLSESSEAQNSLKAMDLENSLKLSFEEVNVPERLKFMFHGLPMSGQSVKNFRITFTADSKNVTAYKIAEDVNELSLLEKSIAITVDEAQNLSTLRTSSISAQSQKAAVARRENIKAGKEKGTLLVPMFKYDIQACGIIERAKNDLKEQTSQLKLTSTDCAKATHFQIDAKPSSRKVVGLNAEQIEDIKQLYVAAKLNNVLTNKDQLADQTGLNLKFLPDDSQVVTQLDNSGLYIYQVTTREELSESDRKILDNDIAPERVRSCSSSDIQKAMTSVEADCVVTLKGFVRISYMNAELKSIDLNGETSSQIELTGVPRAKSTGLISISKNASVYRIFLGSSEQKTIDQIHKVSDLQSKVTTAGKLADTLKVKLNGIDSSASVLTRLDNQYMYIYEVTQSSKLTRGQKILLEKKIAPERIKSCAAAGVTGDEDCVVMLAGTVGISYVATQQVVADLNGETDISLNIGVVPFAKSVGLVSISQEADLYLTYFSATGDKVVNQLFSTTELDNKVSTAAELVKDLKISLEFIKPEAKVLTKLDDDRMLIYEITDISKLTETQKRLLQNGVGNERVKRCSDSDVASAIASKDANCVVVLSGQLGILFVGQDKFVDDPNGSLDIGLNFDYVSRNKSIGVVSIAQDSAVTQIEVTSSILDPNSTLKISDLQGEFFFRRTLEDAASSFLGRTGTSGDMTLVKFELEDDRIVVRNVMSLIQYTGQGAKDKEEMLSLPVTYFRLKTKSDTGTTLALPEMVETTKDKAEFARIDWTNNRIPDASSPLAFFDAGSCFISNSAEKVVATDMRLATDGVLNFSISSSHTVDPACAAIKDVNSYYWSGLQQFNYNVQERISFVRHTNAANTDAQFTMNISHMAQEAFNFGIFTLADKVTDNGTLANRDGSEKYMPMVHDFRNGRVVKWYLGGINDASATDAERRKLLVEAAEQVMSEWNASFRMSFKGTPLERSGDYVQLIVEEPGQETGRLGDLDKNYIWFNEIPADNGLLGVAQPAANPRSGAIESANVIVYTGNTFEQTEILLKMTKMSRQYEKMIEDIKNQAVKQAQAEEEAVSTAEVEAEAEQAAKEAAGSKVSAASKMFKGKTKLKEKNLKALIKSLDLDQKTFANAVKQMDIKQAPGQSNLPAISKDMFKGTRKGQKIDYKVDSRTFTLKLTELAMNKSLQRNPRELEFRMNDVFLTHAGLSEPTKQALNKRQAQLAMMIRFDRAQQNRPGCFSYTRPEVEDNALNADPDPKKNLMLNFKQAVMSTLSHELGHAFGLQHNFMGSTDKAQYEFPGEETKRNYSSIMDYMPDIEQHYAGPGPYDVHAIRAGYTGYVNLNPELLKNAQVITQLKSNKINLVPGATGMMISIADAAKVLGKNSLVHFTKDTVNPTGLLEYYAQCNDMGVGGNIMCARFDNGGSPQEIVANKIADYTRSYANRSYVYDKIVFSWPQKVQVILRNIALFEDIRGFLDQTLIAAIYGSGLGEEKDQAHLYDLIDATVEGYKFFHETVRIPDANTSLMNVKKRFYAIPHQYGVVKRDETGAPVLDGEGKPVVEVKKDIKVLEARALYDVSLSKDKLDTIGIGYDKMFAMNFLLLASEMGGTDDSQMNMISYTDFEQFFLGVKDPSESMTIQTATDILTSNLTAGFHAANGEWMNLDLPIESNRLLADQTAIAAVIGMNQAKWSSYDKFAESLLIARSTVKQAPKDRVNVIRMGQDRAKADSTVYHAGQNSMAANSIIMQAARSEVLVSAKADLFASMKAMSEADVKVKAPIAAVKEKACEMDETTGEPKDQAGCDAALAKSDDEYVKEMPELKQAKAKADSEAKKLVNKLRQLNQKEVIMPKALDAADSKVSFENQVELTREQLFSQLSTINQVLGMLQATPMAELQQTIQFVLQTLQSIQQENEQLAGLPVMAVAQMYMTESTAELKITLQDGQSQITGAQITGLMMNGKKLSEDQAKLTDVIDQLSIFSRYVDADLGITK